MTATSTISTTLAAAVAQTAHNAEKAARQHDKRRIDRDTDRAEFSQLVAQQIESPGDATDPDAQLPDRQAPGYEHLYPHPAPTHAAGDDAGAPTSSSDDHTIETFHHIDVQA